MRVSFTQLLWRIAGADVDIIKQCKTSQKQYANVGAVILMTAGVAFCAGSFAAYFFSCNKQNPDGNILVALAFGVLWSMLIFCIDRALVVTLQKKKERSKLWWVAPFLLRLILAALIATMISIPLELYIFKDYISSSEPMFLSNHDAYYKNHYSGNGDIETYKGLKDDAAKERVRLIGEINALDTTIIQENEILNELIKQKDNPLQYSDDYKKKNKSYTEANNSWKRLGEELNWPEDNQDLIDAKARKDEAKTALSESKTKWEQQMDSEIESHTRTLEGLSHSKDSISRVFSTVDKSYQEANDKHRSLIDKREQDSNENKKAIINGNTFIRNYTILEWAISKDNPENNGKMAKEGAFLWLIRLLFLIIEILPTIVKISTPYGAYDALIEAMDDVTTENSRKIVEKMSSKDDEKPSVTIITNPEHKL